MDIIQPARLQLHRNIKGWTMLPNSISVARPHAWGNPFYVRGPYKLFNNDYCVWFEQELIDRFPEKSQAIGKAIEMFGLWFDKTIAEPGSELYEFRSRYGWRGFQLACVCQNLLHGKNLYCYCEAGTPCHGDVILKLANPGQGLQ